MNVTPRTPEMDEATKKGVWLERIQAVWSRGKWLGILVFSVPFAAATNGADHSVSGYYSGHYYRKDHSADQPSSDGHGSGVLQRTVRKVGDSLWRHRKPSGSTRGHWHGGQR